jgi:transposase
MNIHQNARLTPRGRVFVIKRIESGLPVRQVAAAAGISERTAHRWLKRWRSGDRELVDGSSAPLRCPHRLRPDQLARIEQLRWQRLTSPAIARALSMAVSTVGLALRRLGLNRLARLEAMPPVIRYSGNNPASCCTSTSRPWASRPPQSTYCLAPSG